MPSRQRAEQPTTADDYAAAQAAEWTQFVAAYPIDYYGVRAYNPGDPVPASAVIGTGPEGSAWVPTELVTSPPSSGAVPEGSPTVVDPGPPTVDPTTVAAPQASSPTAPQEA